ncbi:major facilitator superfamily domain-containing protein [Elsinoe ampelina]|uniref:Major facilitator superfamily domain-containing protein n=1 Tax=Elsinoe ampelina TaxID=302913 RepID=A0A6A6GNH5_9PEZI|nr:major facilitator superfamily domain-containing protein [Elsinoe ampelina]
MTTSIEAEKVAADVEQLEVLDKAKAQANGGSGDVQLIGEDGNIRRIPIPSSDPNDPSSFSKWRNLGVLIACCWFSIFSLVLVGGLGPILSTFFALYGPEGRSTQEVVNLTTFPSLVMAVGAFLILPLTMAFGRRPVFSGCSILRLGFTIGAATSQSYNTHMACRILQETAAGSTESVLPLIITDMSFLDERGFYFGIYWGMQNLINTVFLISTSYLTRFQRKPTSMNGQVVHTDEWGITHFLSDAEPEHDLSCSSPAVMWAVLVASITLGIGIAMSVTYATILTKLFVWSYKSIGLVNIGVFPASIFAMIWTGTIGDRFNVYLAKRRGGVHHPEDTLLQLIFPFFVGVIGVVIYGVTAMYPQRMSSWGIIMRWTLFQFAFVVVLITTTHFGSEAYPKNPGPALVIVIGMKNVLSFGASFGIIPMVNMYSYLKAFMILLAFFIGLFLLGIPVYILNPRWRAYIGRKQSE